MPKFQKLEISKKPKKLRKTQYYMLEIKMQGRRKNKFLKTIQERVDKGENLMFMKNLN